MTKAGDILIDALKEIEDLGANGCTAARLGNIAHAALIEHRAASRPVQEPVAWQPIETAPKEKWIIGYTSWGQHVGKFHEWVGPCEWCTDHFEFTNTDFDVFPLPTHWHPLPAPLSLTGETGKTDA